jgi:CotH protein
MQQLSSVVMLAMILAGGVACDGAQDDVDRPEGWNEESHGKDAPPDYDRLFATTGVHTILVTITPADYQTMQDDLEEIFASSGDPGGGGGELPPDITAACEGLEVDAPCEILADDGTTTAGTCRQLGDALACIPADGPGGGDPGGGGGVSLLSREPIYVPVTVGYDGLTWSHVGMRYKGNSSLSSSYSAGSGKHAFRLDFDEFEGDYPEIEDQRFYGFKKMTFSSNWNDDSFIREAYVNEVLRDRGIPAARCAFYRVMVDVGSGPAYWGLYTMIEDPSDDAMLDSQLDGKGGNLYKPEGTGADWTVFSEEGFVKKTNEDEADWSDVSGAVAALHADRSDAVAWRAALEATFDVEHFLKWLALNTTIVNWDAYGNMAHNYYLYVPEGGTQLLWIPWDHNLSMSAQLGPGGGGPGGGGSGSVDAATEVFHSTVSATSWPLIALLLDDPVYRQVYRDGLENALGGLFEVDAATTRLRELHDLVAPHVIGDDGEQPGFTHLTSEQAFLESVDGEAGLAAHVATRHTRVREALDQ